MKDVLLVLSHLFNWRFSLILGCLIAAGLFLPERRLQLFRSVRFNIYLFLLIAVASAYGTFLPIEQSARVVYHSWWFAGLLALMAFDVVACKLRRFPQLIFGPRSSLHSSETIEQFFSKSKLKENFLVSHDSDKTAQAIRTWFKNQGLAFSENNQSEGVAFFSGRHLVQRYGDFILHVSIVAILAGNLMGVMFGFEEVLPIPEGQTLQMKNKPYEVTLKHFKIDYYQDTNAPRLYQSELVVREKGRILAQKKIVVNDPLDIDRVRFYQASWGMTYDFRSAKLRLGGGVLELKPKEVTPIPGTPLSVRANMFLPSFDLDRNGQPTTLNFEGHNPAVQFDFLEKNKIQAQVWLLKNDPTQAYRIVDDRVMPAAPPPFSLVDVDPVLFSGIQVGYDPGAPLFWGSAIVLLIGLCMHFYLHQRRLRILVIAKGRQSQIHLGGWNSRSREDFEQEFSEWAADLRRAVIS